MHTKNTESTKMEMIAMLAGMQPSGPWQMPGLQPGMNKFGAGTLGAAPTSALTVSEIVRAQSSASQVYSNRLAGVPESPAQWARYAKDGMVASGQWADSRSGGLAGLGEVVQVPSTGDKAMWLTGGLVLGVVLCKTFWK